MVWRYDMANKTSGQNIQNPNNRLQTKFLTELQELEVRIRVQPNFPIVILSLLTGLKRAWNRWSQDAVYGRITEGIQAGTHNQC